MKQTASQSATDLLDVIPLIMRSVRHEMKRTSSGDLSMAQFRILTFLGRRMEWEPSLSILAHHLGVTLPTASRMVDTLVRKKWICRKPSSHDRRHIVLSMTPQGSILIRKMRQSALDALAEHLSELSERDHARISQTMRILQPVFAPLVKQGRCT